MQDSVGEHPWWCSPAHCYRTKPEGVRVHVQARACWEDDDGKTRFRTGLVSAEDEHSGTACLELELHSVLTRGGVYALLSLWDARRLRDQLSAHLDAAESGRRNRVLGVKGHLLTSSDEPAHADGGAE